MTRATGHRPGAAADRPRRTRRRTRARVAVLALLLGVAQLAAVAGSAHACGCGAVVPGEGSDVAVTGETSVVRWDGTTQDIVMRLDVTGDATEAAWIMPVPDRAEVTLGDRSVFTHLRSLSGPEYRERHYFWPREGDWPRADDHQDGVAAGGGAEPVEVVGRDRLGPFDVARLAAADPAALDGWLTDNGFPIPDELADGVAPYVAEGWEFVAVRLAPDAVDEDGEVDDGESAEPPVLGGQLDPLHLTFDTDTPVYPMRLSRLADNPQDLRLYVLADHRTEPAGNIGGAEPEVEFAGRLPADEDLPEVVRDLAGDHRFLTVLSQRFDQPERITDDHELVRAAEDTEYQAVVYRDRLLTWGGVPAWQVVTGGVLLLVVGGGAAVPLARRRARRSATG